MHTCASFLKDAEMHWHWQIKMRRIVNKKFKRPWVFLGVAETIVCQLLCCGYQKLQQKLSTIAATFKIAACPLWATVDQASNPASVLHNANSTACIAASLRIAPLDLDCRGKGREADVRCRTNKG